MATTLVLAAEITFSFTATVEVKDKNSTHGYDRNNYFHWPSYRDESLGAI
ncbi:MAG: hypothetical protein LBV77_00820 [Candidatus Adiutrix intracellularis]|nr:hypothetical protein [Candidatus Adiutrix intracellularis]